MKSVIKAIIFLVMAFTVIFYGGALLLPGEARVERSITISAPPDTSAEYAVEEPLPDDVVPDETTEP